MAKKFRLPLQYHRFGKKNKDTITKKGEFFIAKTTPNNLSFSRFGIIIGAKIVKSAVKRNQLKRMFFNFIRLNKLELIPGRDVLIIALPCIEKLKEDQIKNKLL